MKYLFGIVCCCFSVICMAQETGTIAGKLVDKGMNGEPLSFANVVLKGTTKGTITDMDGLYKIENVKPETYTLVFSFVGYETVEIPNVVVEPNKVTEVSSGLGASAAALGEVVVKVVKRQDSPVALLLEQKDAIEIKESIGSVELAKLGVSDVATASTKISGVTASEASGDLYVRGLGDRYLYTTMNGLPIPSDDVSRKNIDLELFPTRVVKTISISKTFSPETSADQSSGNIDIQTRELIGEKEFSIGLETGFNSNVIKGDTWNNFKRSPNMDEVSLGFYSRDMSTKEAITRQGWDPGNISMPLNYQYTLSAGKRFGEKFEILFTAAHAGDYEFREGVYHKYRRNYIDESFEDVREWITSRENTAMLNLGYEINDSHSLSAVSLFVNKLTDEVYEAGKDGNGYVFEETPESSDLSQFIRDQNTKQTRLWINQLLGEHHLSEHNTLSWALGYNMVNADEPNRIRNEINFNENLIEFGKTGGYQQRKSLQEITDNEINARLKDELVFFDKESTSLKVNFGGNYRSKKRDFVSQFFAAKESSNNILEPASLDDISGAFNPENLEAGLFNVNERRKDTYEAELESVAGFASVNYSINKFNFNIGARFQDDRLSTHFDVANFAGNIGSSEKNYNSIYPSINLRYALNEKNNLRLAASKTITLPEFKEFSPFEYVSPTGEVTKGNPDLMASTNYNLDLKWELFPTPGQLVSLTGFYKRIEDPISRVKARGSADFYSYFNAGEKAEIYGLELDADLDLIKADENGAIDLGFGMNAAYLWHSQDLKVNEEKRYSFRYKNLTETGLQGASDWILNAALNFATHTENQTRASISANYASDKIYALGAPEIQTQSEVYYNDAIMEKGFVMLNAVLGHDLNEHLSLELKAKNLLNPRIERTQLVRPVGGTETEETVRSFKKGMVVSLQLKYTF